MHRMQSFNVTNHQTYEVTMKSLKSVLKPSANLLAKDHPTLAKNPLWMKPALLAHAHGYLPVAITRRTGQMSYPSQMANKVMQDYPEKELELRDIKALQELPQVMTHDQAVASIRKYQAAEAVLLRNNIEIAGEDAFDPSLGVTFQEATLPAYLSLYLMNAAVSLAQNAGIPGSDNLEILSLPDLPDIVPELAVLVHELLAPEGVEFIPYEQAEVA